MFSGKGSKLRIETERMTLRLPQRTDFAEWAKLRLASREFLTPWEPSWASDHLTKRAFNHRVQWSQKVVKNRAALPLFLVRREDQKLLGALTLDNIRRGPAQAGTIGYWVGRDFARQGYMSEAIVGVVHYAFARLDLSRVEAACLPTNKPSRGVLEKAGFKYEGVAQAYLQINGRWENHVLYAQLRSDRRGATSAGM